MQLNASPRTDSAGDAQLQSTLPTMSCVSSPNPGRQEGSLDP